MSRSAGILMSLVLVACGGGDGTRTELTSTPDAGRMSGCATDTDCNPGMLCEGCGDGFFTCVPGCRTDSQCGTNMICSHDVQCLSCPCPSGYCDLDPCRDLDGDGFAAALAGVCPGKQIGDCNDGLATTHPGGRERCANGQDDDCDGRTDARDDECRDTCDVGFNFCTSSINCGTDRFCEEGCCEQCVSQTDPICGADQCLLPGGLDADGCTRPGVCGACQSCSADSEPVCGRNFATYTNECYARAAGTEPMHTGECLRGEGFGCEEKNDCFYDQLCRDFADAGLHCAKIGTCGTDADCAYVTGFVSCGDAGAAPWVCRNERCAAVCP